VREAARLHSFPDWFRLHQTKWHGFRQVGNAVAPLVGRAVGSSIVAALGLNPPIPTRLRLLGTPALLQLKMSEAADHFGVDGAALPAQRVREKPLARA
jgi:DNA (cytosine-5)-methyltransferase 1